MHASTIDGLCNVLSVLERRPIPWMTAYEVLAGSGRYRGLEDLVRRRVELANDTDFMARVRQGVVPETKARNHYYNERRANRTALQAERRNMLQGATRSPPKKKRRSPRTPHQIAVSKIRSAVMTEVWRRRRTSP